MKNWRERLPLFLLAALYVFHFWQVMQNAVDLPLSDAWEFLASDQLPAGFSFEWLFRRHNEHRIVLTKLVTWFLYRWNEWNVIVETAINFQWFGCLILVFFWLRARLFSECSRGNLAWFLIFLLTAGNSQNLSNGFQSQFHFMLLFLLLGVGFLFDPRERKKDLILGIASLLISVYCLGSGPPAALAVSLVYFIYQWERRGRGRGLVVVGLVWLAIGLWFVGFHPAPGHPPSSLPYHARFWLYFVELVSLGFGYLWPFFPIGCLSLFVVIFPLGKLFPHRKEAGREGYWGLCAGVGGILFALAAISVGRAGFGVASSKTSRYLEVAMMLVPFTYFAWSLYGLGRARTQRSIFALWLFCAGGFSNLNHWHFGHYKYLSEQLRTGRVCIDNYYKNGGEALCESIYPWSLKDRLENARRLHISFTHHGGT